MHFINDATQFVEFIRQDRYNMEKLNPAFLAAMADSVNKSLYYVHTSMEIKEIDQGYCLMQLTVEKPRRRSH